MLSKFRRIAQNALIKTDNFSLSYLFCRSRPHILLHIDSLSHDGMNNLSSHNGVGPYNYLILLPNKIILDMKWHIYDEVHLCTFSEIK